MTAEYSYIQNTIDYPPGFVWHLQSVDDRGIQANYVCQTARFHGARAEDCTTPSFKLPDISEEALEYMHHFVKIFQLGYLAGLEEGSHGPKNV